MHSSGLLVLEVEDKLRAVLEVLGEAGQGVLSLSSSAEHVAGRLEHLLVRLHLHELHEVDRVICRERQKQKCLGFGLIFLIWVILLATPDFMLTVPYKYCGIADGVHPLPLQHAADGDGAAGAAGAGPGHVVGPVVLHCDIGLHRS